MWHTNGVAIGKNSIASNNNGTASNETRIACDGNRAAHGKSGAVNSETIIASDDNGATNSEIRITNYKNRTTCRKNGAGSSDSRITNDNNCIICYKNRVALSCNRIINFKNSRASNNSGATSFRNSLACFIVLITTHNCRITSNKIGIAKPKILRRNSIQWSKAKSDGNSWSQLRSSISDRHKSAIEIHKCLSNTITSKTYRRSSWNQSRPQFQ